MNNQDYLFLLFIDRHYTNVYLTKLIQKYGKGIPLLERRKLKRKANKIRLIDNPKEVLFIYIIFKRTHENNYIDELAKDLRKELGDIDNKELSYAYKCMKKLLKKIDIEPPAVTAKVIANIRKFNE